LTQVRVSHQEGGVGFIFWNARNDYSKPFDAMPNLQAALTAPAAPPHTAVTAKKASGEAKASGAASRMPSGAGHTSAN